MVEFLPGIADTHYMNTNGTVEVATFPGNQTMHSVINGKPACGHVSRRYNPVIVAVTIEEEEAWAHKCDKCYGVA